MRSLLVAVLLLAAPAEDDVAARYGLQPADVHSTFFSNVVGDRFWLPPPTAQLRALDGKGRAAAVQALGALARAYVASDDFRARYATWRQDTLGKPPTPPKTFEQAEADRKAKLATLTHQIDDQIRNLPPEQQEHTAQALKSLIDESKRAPMDRAAYEQTITKRYAEAQKAYVARAAKLSTEPTPLLAAALQRFLDTTADVDFAAKLVDQGGHKLFAREDYERKPDLWKRAFRAGPEATGAARKVAQDWLRELK